MSTSVRKKLDGTQHRKQLTTKTKSAKILKVLYGSNLLSPREKSLSVYIR